MVAIKKIQKKDQSCLKMLMTGLIETNFKDKKVNTEHETQIKTKDQDKNNCLCSAVLIVLDIYKM